ncbi:hypothetical protein [Streptomyces cremeus]|uniref:Uncharacterized protein n=1 Tax=Streptomyces cremeus TaxID=66881 RepID=A0ABV5PG13_STRCM
METGPPQAPPGLIAAYLGQILGIALLIGKTFGGASFVDVLVEDFSAVHDLWQEGLEPISFLFFALAAFGAVTGAKKAAR